MTRVPFFTPPGPADAPRSRIEPLPPVEAVRGGRAVAADVARLAELQAKLLAADWRAASGRATGAAAALVVGGVLAASALPVFLVALGYGLIAAGLPGWAAFLLAGVAGLAVGGLCLRLGVRRLGAAAGTFGRSRAALSQNAGWVKRSLTREPHPPNDLAAPPTNPPRTARPR